MAKLTRRGKFDSQIESFKQLKLKADRDIQSVTSNCGVTNRVDSIVKRIEEVLKQDQEKLRNDPGYQEAMKYRKKLIDAKRKFESANKEYQEKYMGVFDSKVNKIDRLRHTEWKRSKQLEDMFHLYGSTLDEARVQNGENFDNRINLVRKNKEYQEALLAKKNLLKLKRALLEALNDYEKELDYNDEENLGNNNEENNVGQIKKVRKVESPNKTLSTLGINYEKVDGIILPTDIDGKRIVRSENSNNSQSIEEIKYANKILILFEKVFNDLGFARDDYKVFVGKTNKNMVRKLPYIVVEFPKINKTIIVNNLYGEATFLCDNIFGNREYLKLSKEDLLKQYAETVMKVDYFDETSWSNQIKLRLSQGKGCINDNDAWKDQANPQENSQEKGLSYKNKISGLTDEEELALLKSYKEGNDIAARDKIFYLYRDRSKFWLQKILRKYEDEYDLAETDIDDLYQDDLYQESDLILLNAIENFVENFEENVNNEKKFTNYLRIYYFSKMQQYLDDKFELVSTDFSMHEELELDKNINDLGFQLKTLSSKKQNEVIEEEKNSQKREDDSEETGVDGGKTEVDEEEIEECCEEKGQPILVEIWNLFKGTSIDSDLDRQHTLASLKIELNRAIGTLSQREQDVLRLYFGLDGNYPKTLEEIGEKLDITMERVRQIKERALKRLKHMNRSNVLRRYQKD